MLINKETRCVISSHKISQKSVRKVGVGREVQEDRAGAESTPLFTHLFLLVSFIPQIYILGWRHKMQRVNAILKDDKET